MEKTIDLRTSVTELPASGVSWAAIAAGALASLVLPLEAGGFRDKNWGVANYRKD